VSLSLSPAIPVPKLAAGVLDTSGAPSLGNIHVNFRKKFEMTSMLFSGAGRKIIHEKNLEQDIS
jgi:hypothetical protein